MALTVVTCLTDAQNTLNELAQLVQELPRDMENPALTKEEHYLELVTPKLDAAAAKYQALAAFLQENKVDHDKAYRALQRSFVTVMQDLQQVQRAGAKRREALCDADFLAVSKISAEDIQVAKEEVLGANQIAAEAGVVKQLFQEVGVIIHHQGQGIDQIERKVENIRIEIGHGVDELRHARQLQREARQKHMLIVVVLLLVAAAIVIPIVLAFT